MALIGLRLNRSSIHLGVWWGKNKIFHYFLLWSLKTLLNIVEAPFKKLLNFDVCVVLFRMVNKQPGMQKFLN